MSDWGSSDMDTKLEGGPALKAKCSAKSSAKSCAKCCEPGCSRIISADDKGKGQCKSCNRPLCGKCLSYSRDRAARNTFYVPYTSYCDTCIWFDMG